MVVRCYWKGVAESRSQEGKQFRKQHPEIPFDYCRGNCNGRAVTTCEHYTQRFIQNEAEIEQMEDSSLVQALQGVQIGY